MPSTHRRRSQHLAASVLSVLGAVALLLALLGSGDARVLAQDDEEEPEPITVELVGSGIPSTVDGQELALRKITFQPGAVLPAHSHPGALVLTVVQGELAYTLFEGEATIQRAGEDGEPGPVEPLIIDEEAILDVGDSLFEEDVVHQAGNPGDEPTIVWVSSLLSEGEPFVHLAEEHEDDGAASSNVVEVELNEFDLVMPDELPAGNTTFEITNTGSVAHNFAIGGVDGGALETVLAPGESATLTVDLPAGEFEVICPLANHADLGMSTTLTVVEAEGDEGDEGDEAEDEEEDAPEADEDDAEAAAEPVEITIDIADFAFDPGSVEIVPGTIVTWVNNDAAPHTVTSDDGGATFDSGTLDPGGSFSFTFEDEGSVAYHCDIHPTMTATIEVVAATDADEDDDEDASAATDGGDGDTVEISGFAFAPETLAVAVGTTVTWVNNDQAPHTVTSDDGLFDSERLEPGDEFTFTFAEAGSFAYHCDLHPRMTATVEVS